MSGLMSAVEMANLLDDLLPLDAFGHVINCGFDFNDERCDCSTLPTRLHAVIARHVAAALDEVADAIKVRADDAWQRYMTGPGGPTEALRQGKFEGLSGALAIVRATKPPT